MIEVRCPNDAKLVAVRSEDFLGDVALFCPRCKVNFGSDTSDLPRVMCPCGRRWLASGVVRQGWVRVGCKRCAMLVTIDANGPTRLETPDKPGPKLRRPKPINTDDLVAYLEDRWRMLRLGHARRRSEVAVGLRFDVLNRDGFRCRYCGRAADEGLALEVDHVVPRARGGTDDLGNLVTACWDCNRGKSAKALDAMEGMRIIHTN